MKKRRKGGKFMIKGFKKIALTLFISSAIACSGVAQSSNHWENQLAPQRDKGKRGPERPVERKRNGDRGDRGGSKRGDDSGKRGKRPGQF
ncbi:MAG TPA: hypothetical protein VIM99_16345 [Blastocatellia bacterium]